MQKQLDGMKNTKVFWETEKPKPDPDLNFSYYDLR